MTLFIFNEFLVPFILYWSSSAYLILVTTFILCYPKIDWKKPSWSNNRYETRNKHLAKVNAGSIKQSKKKLKMDQRGEWD